MMLRALITAALIAWPFATSALTPVMVPECVEGGVEYYGAEPLGEDIVYTESYQTEGAGAYYNWLVGCASGQGVRATSMGNYEIDFHSLSVQLADSSEIYTLEDVAKLAREAGWDARVMPFPASCVCKLGR